MTGRSHFIIGGMMSVAILRQIGVTEPLVLTMGFGMGALGGLVPDLDSDESELRQLTGTARSAGFIGWLVSLIIPKHRGITHTAWVCGLLVYFALRYPAPFIVAFVVGYVYHILADMLTIRGVKLFSPFINTSFGLPLFKTGSFGEHFIVLCLAAAWVISLFFKVPL